MKRPLGISILTVLYFLGGAAMLIMQLGFASRFSEGFGAIGVSAIAAHLAVGFLALLGLGAGYGMWTAKRWGWWLGSFYLTYSVARSANALITLHGLLENAGISSAEAAPHFIKFTGRIIVHSLICWYFFSEGVERYFQVFGTSRLKRLAKLVGATLAVAAFFGVLNAIA